ncbi:MAG: hypothetical protein ABJC04_05450, partial [Verrucomicrobiota bacterium]
LAAFAILSVDFFARKLAERRIQKETGMETHIEKLSIGFSTHSLHLQNLVMKNTAAFGGTTFLEMPELFIDYDRDALRGGKLHLKVVRVSLATIRLVENKNGQRNVDGLPKENFTSQTGSGEKKSMNSFSLPVSFDGIDLLEVTLGTAEFTSAKNPALNMKQELGIRDETFRNLKTESDFQTVAAVIMLKCGFNFWLAGGNIGQSRVLLKEDSQKRKHKSAQEKPGSDSQIQVDSK